MDRFTLLSTFARVAETRSFTKAGASLGVSRATVSGSIRDLEAHLGARLLHRTTRSVSLTPEGQLYYEHVQEILAKLEKEAQAAQSRLIRRRAKAKRWQEELKEMSRDERRERAATAYKKARGEKAKRDAFLRYDSTEGVIFPPADELPPQVVHAIRMAPGVIELGKGTYGFLGEDDANAARILAKNAEEKLWAASVVAVALSEEHRAILTKHGARELGEGSGTYYFDNPLAAKNAATESRRFMPQWAAEFKATNEKRKQEQLDDLRSRSVKLADLPSAEAVGLKKADEIFESFGERKSATTRTFATTEERDIAALYMEQKLKETLATS